jgi:hypothetical protein
MVRALFIEMHAMVVSRLIQWTGRQFARFVVRHKAGRDPRRQGATGHNHASHQKTRSGEMPVRPRLDDRAVQGIAMPLAVFVPSQS